MIKFEHGMLVLDSSATLEDMQAISEFQEYVRNKEQEHILKELDAMADTYLIEHYYVEAALIVNAIEYLKNSRVQKEGS
jgi:hypothetical protein